MISPLLQAKLSDYLGKKPLAELMEGFPEEMIKKATRYRQAADQYRYALGRELLRKGMAKFGENEEVLDRITYTEQGKPILPNIWFSITHSGNYVCCMISSEGPIGLDVEVVQPLDKPEHLRDWFTAAEWQWIQQSTDPLRNLYLLWTKKEALLKAIGCGLSGLGKIKYDADEQMYFEGFRKKWTIKDLGFSEEEGVVGHVCY